MDRRDFLFAAVAVSASTALRAQEDVRIVRFSVLLSNPTGQALRNQRLWMYLPAQQAAHVHAVRQSCSGPHTFLGDRLGHNIAELMVDVLPAYGQQAFKLSVDVQAGSGSAAPEQPAMWLAAQTYIESDHPDIRAVAAALGGSSPADAARRAWAWVGGHMTYAGYLSEDYGALRALQTGRGDCTEYASLLVALCRACGIPARMVGGYVSDRSFVPRPADYHNWAEIWIEGRWRVADAQLGNWLQLEDHYIPLRYYWDKPINPVGLAHRYRVEGEAVAVL
jgi:hypothetical protein